MAPAKSSNSSSAARSPASRPSDGAHLMLIKDKVVVITGGASGLGQATARHFADELGAKVAILDLNAKAGAQTVAEIGAERAMFVRTDVTDEASVQSAVDDVTARFGALHVCINCAAFPGVCKVLGKDGKATPLAKFAQTTEIGRAHV